MLAYGCGESKLIFQDTVNMTQRTKQKNYKHPATLYVKRGENILGKLFLSRKDTIRRRMIPMRKGKGTGIYKIPAITAELVID